MTSSGLAYMTRALGGTFLTVVTVGLAYPWREAALERYKMGCTFYGDLPRRFEGEGWVFFKRGWWLWLMALGPIAGLGVILHRPAEFLTRQGDSRIGKTLTHCHRRKGGDDGGNRDHTQGFHGD